MKNKILFVLCLLAQQILAQNQDIAQDIPLGTWRLHLNYHRLQSLALAPDKVFAASQQGLFAYHKNNKNIEKIGKTEGLSDVNIAQINFYEQKLLIAYQNGNIDILAPDQIINIRSILNRNFADKNTFHIQCQQKEAYLSMAFGLVILDLEKYQIKESITQIGNNAQSIAVYATAIFNDRLYAATAEGLKSIDLNNRNKLDFRNWTTHHLSPSLRHLAVFNNNLYVAIANEDIYKLVGNQLVRMNLPFRQNFNELKSTAQGLFLCLESTIVKIQEDATFEILSNALVSSPKKLLLDENNIFWIADHNNGLITNQDGNFRNIVPSGTFSPDVWQVKALNNKIFALSGGYKPNSFYNNFADSYVPQNNENGFYVFENGIWTNFNAADNLLDNIKIPRVRDLVDVVYNSSNQKYYFASFQDGILVWDTPNNTFEVLNTTNSPLSNNRVVALGVDRENTLWAATFGAESRASVFALQNNGQWQPFLFRNLALAYPLLLNTDDANNIWVSINPLLGGGIFVFNQKGQELFLNNINNLQSTKINALHYDRRGNMWLGTDLGIRVFYAAPNVITQNNPRAEAIIYQRRELLNNEKITAIASDGANRKWIGTENGVWLFDESKGQMEANFTEQNSPLLSNKVHSIAVEPRTGEVFLGTEKGIVSYRGTASEANFRHENVQIFPNPVLPNFEGLVGISGLVSGAIVKILDISGKLIFETSSQGGTAVWNKQDLQGRKAKSGIYLVFSASPDGSESFVGKLALLD